MNWYPCCCGVCDYCRGSAYHTAAPEYDITISGFTSTTGESQTSCNGCAEDLQGTFTLKYSENCTNDPRDDGTGSAYFGGGGEMCCWTWVPGTFVDDYWDDCIVTCTGWNRSYCQLRLFLEPVAVDGVDIFRWSLFFGPEVAYQNQGGYCLIWAAEFRHDTANRDTCTLTGSESWDWISNEIVRDRWTGAAWVCDERRDPDNPFFCDGESASISVEAG